MMDLVRQWPGEMMLLLAQVGALGVGGFQLDVRFSSSSRIKSKNLGLGRH